MGIPTNFEDFDYIEMRAMNEYDDPSDFNMNTPEFQKEDYERHYNPYEQDLSRYPEIY